MRLKFLIPLFAFAALVAILFFGLWLDPSKLPSALVGKPVPEFALPPIAGWDGAPQGFSSGDLKGQVALVNFFASWCIPCKAEHPLLLRLAKEEQIPIFGVNYKDKPEDAKRWIETLGDPYVRLGADTEGTVAINWGVYGVPETYIVNKQGEIVYRQVGPMSPDDLEKKILPLVRELRQ